MANMLLGRYFLDKVGELGSPHTYLWKSQSVTEMAHVLVSSERLQAASQKVAKQKEMNIYPVVKPTRSLTQCVPVAKSTRAPTLQCW